LNSAVQVETVHGRLIRAVRTAMSAKKQTGKRKRASMGWNTPAKINRARELRQERTKTRKRDKYQKKVPNGKKEMRRERTWKRTDQGVAS